MKFRSVLVLFVVMIAAAARVPGVRAESENSVNLGFGGVPRLMAHCKANVYTAEFEHALSPHVTVFARGAGIDYRFDDGKYLEKGKPLGIEAGGRYYLSGGMKGFYVGGSLGYWRWDWTFAHNQDTRFLVQGKADSDVLRLNIDAGWRFALGSSPVSVTPALNIGKFFHSTSCNYTYPASAVAAPCGQSSEVQAYVYVGLMVGYGF